MSSRRIVTSAALTAAILVACTEAFAGGITVGNANDVNCFPFSCGPTDFLTQYQEVYNHSAFPGAISFNQISFTSAPGYAGEPMDSGTYAVSFYLSTEAVGSLSSDLAANEGTFLGSLGTFTLGGPMPSVLDLTGSTINYDPSMGNLLMNVDISNGTSYDGVYNAFFNADATGTDVSRAYFRLEYGAHGNDTGALQTTFTLASVPEPATWGLLVLGLGAIGLRLSSQSRKRLAA